MRTKPTREEKKARTRERLLDAAAKVIAREGYRGASLDEIADLAGLTKGAVYSNFRSKEELFFELMERGLPIDVSVLGDRSRPLAERVAAFARQGAKLSGSRRLREHSSLELEFALLAQRDERARALVRRINRRSREELGAFLQREAEHEGRSLALDGTAFATVLLGTLRGLMQQRAYDPSSVQEDLIAAAVHLLFSGRAG